MLFLFHSLPVLASPWLLRCSCSTHASQVFPLISGLVSRAFFPVLCTRLSVCFLSPFLASLPQLLGKCLLGSVPLSVPFALAFPLSFCFLSSASVPVPITQLPFLPFPSSLLPLTVVLQVPFSTFPSACYQLSVPVFGTQPCCNSFLRLSASLHSSYCSASAFFLSVSGLVPLVITLGSGYLAGAMHLQN